MTNYEKEELKERLIESSDAINRSEDAYDYGMQWIDKLLGKFGNEPLTNDLFTLLHNKLELEILNKFIFKGQRKWG